MTEAPTEPVALNRRRTPARQKARQLAKRLRAERPDYIYLKEVFRHLRTEVNVKVQREPKKLPYVPTEGEIRRYYETVWKERRGGDIVLIKTLLYIGFRVAELVAIRLDDVDLDACRIRITQGKGNKDRVVPFPASFKETLALHIAKCVSAIEHHRSQIRRHLGFREGSVADAGKPVSWLAEHVTHDERRPEKVGVECWPVVERSVSSRQPQDGSTA
ncbi:MAG: tyrosine-type recombinase/integrase [Acidimicrobiales bacterium]